MAKKETSARRDTLHALECGNERGGNNVAKAAEMDKERAEQTAVCKNKSERRKNKKNVNMRRNVTTFAGHPYRYTHAAGDNVHEHRANNPAATRTFCHRVILDRKPWLRKK